MKTILLNVALLNALLLMFSCNKENEGRQLIEETPDPIQILKDDPAYFLKENAVNLFMDNISVTQEQRVVYQDESLFIIQKTKQTPKQNLAKSVEADNKNEEGAMYDCFQAFADAMSYYTTSKGVSEQFTFAISDLIESVSELPAKIAESSVVLDLTDLIGKHLINCKKQVLLKYVLSEIEILYLNKALSDIENILTTDAFLATVNDIKIENSFTKIAPSIAKGFWSSLVNVISVIGKVVLTVAAVALGAAGGAMVGFVGGALSLNPVGGAVGVAIIGGIAASVYAVDMLWYDFMDNGIIYTR